MGSRLIIGLDGEGSGARALAYGRRLAELIGDCELVLVYVVEWSPYTFHTPEENAERHKHYEEEITTAHERVIDPALAQLKADGVTARGLVRHGNVADTLEAVATAEGADQIVVARGSDGGFAKRLFGSATATLVMNASVPVTVVN